MKRKSYLGFSVLLLFTSLMAQSQSSVSQQMYVDYQKFLGNFNIKSITGTGSAPKTIKKISDEATLITDETPIANGSSICNLAPGTLMLTGEEIYAKRKESVFIFGKLMKAADATGEIAFNLTGTAFALSADGVCVTNYHVFSDILNLNPENSNDSVFFIMTADNQTYFVDSILAYSQNNDLLIFHVNTNGHSLQPIPLGKPAQVGAVTYCISNPSGYFYYFSQGIVARNVVIGTQQAAAGYNPNGKPPIRMEITADYAIGSSGGPILDKYGNLIGVVSSTTPAGFMLQDKAGSFTGHQQMVIKDTAPVMALSSLLGR